MSLRLICNKCGAVIEKCGDVNEIKITPYITPICTVETKSKTFDLCKDCTETFMQYINNNVQMLIFNDSETQTGEETENDKE